jgi:hypothetical protein
VNTLMTFRLSGSSISPAPLLVLPLVVRTFHRRIQYCEEEILKLFGTQMLNYNSRRQRSLIALVVDYLDHICEVGIGAEGVVLRK